MSSKAGDRRAHRGIFGVSELHDSDEDFEIPPRSGDLPPGGHGRGPGPARSVLMGPRADLEEEYDPDATDQDS